ncbi:hypothetical protein [Sabulicella rubraurantiaca]|uniref:hypothetical protein n=1 Tax=Sabulicella rubraurantiaca TaxID=2811429 RepID=UPI001A963F86|nr:hypothetical protein [Sabulicella rubraurantiaca]
MSLADLKPIKPVLAMNAAACVAAAFLGYAGLPWYLIPVLAGVLMAISSEKSTAYRPISREQWLLVWLVATAFFSIILMIMFWIGHLLR